MPRRAEMANNGPLTLLQAADVAQWFEAFSPSLRAMLIRATSLRGADLEDVLQDVWVQAIRYAAKLATLSERHRRNYLLHIARTVSSNRARIVFGKQGNNMARADVMSPLTLSAIPIDEDKLPLTPVTVSHDWMAQADVEQTTAVRLSLQAVWDATPPEYRDLLTLLMQGYSNAEMATTLGVDRHVIETRIWRMRQVLREVGRKIA